jgi:membrane protein insertase Oxa1/YidC/SpoIIIJ
MIRRLPSPWPSFCTVSVTPAPDANYTIIIIIIIIIITFLGYLIVPKNKSDSTALITG